MACVLRNVLSPYSKRPSRLFTSRDATYTRRSKDPVRAKSETSTTSGVGNSNSSEFEEVNGLLVDILGVAMETGPSGVARSLSAAQACASLAATLIVSSQNPQPKPEELLRRVFEALGSTYIKLGQFIASSPTLFPEEYVQEFQNCFDRTPTVPFAKIATSSAQTSASPWSLYSSRSIRFHWPRLLWPKCTQLCCVGVARRLSLKY